MRRTIALFLLLQALALQWASAAHISILKPANHSLWAVHSSLAALKELVVEFTVDDEHRDDFIKVTGDKIEGDLRVPASQRIISFGGIEPGTYFWKFSLVRKNGSSIHHSDTTVLHFEVVVPQRWPAPEWIYRPTIEERTPQVLFNLPLSIEKPTNRRLCVVGSLASAFDGQKKMWLQVISKLASPEWSVKVLTFEERSGPSPFSNALDRLDVPIVHIPLQISTDDLAAHGILPEQAISALLVAFQSEFGSARTIISMDTFNDHVHRLSPVFAAEVWRRIVLSIHTSCNGAAFVFANSRSDSDQLLVTAARVAGVAGVTMELSNLEPAWLAVDTLISPSHFALQHPSVINAVTARQRYVVHAGIDTSIFEPLPGAESTSTATRKNEFILGYVGRLSPEKSVGLLLRAVRLLLSTTTRPFSVRIIGEGPQRERLEMLIEEWGLQKVVTFVGGVYDERVLARILQTMDVFISTRFKETLGIAPLEAMSCGVPVIGFASGGVGEYLDHEVNGLAVNEPTGEAIRDAVLALMNNETMRMQLGSQARATVLRQFSHQVGLNNYVRLYERLADSR